MATINFSHTSYQITRVLIVNNPDSRDHGMMRICATEIDHPYAAAQAWRADVMFTYFVNDNAVDARFRKGWYYSSNNVGTLLNNPEQIAIIDAALDQYTIELAADAANISADHIENIAVDMSDFDAADDSTPAAHPLRAETINRALEKNVKITDTMVNNSHTLRDVAADYIRSYRGTNSFVQSIAVYGVDRGFFSVAQMRGTLNVMISEARQQRADDKADALAFDARHNDGAPSSAIQQFFLDIRSNTERLIDDAGDAPSVDESAQDVPALRLPDARYTVTIDPKLPLTGYRTLRLSAAPAFFNAAPGTQIAGYLSGADNENSYTNFAFVIDGTIKVWDRFAGTIDSKIVKALTILLASADPTSHMRDYVLRSQRCAMCGLPLTTPQSLQDGIGPVCKRKLAGQGVQFSITPEQRAEAAQRADSQMAELFPD